MFREGHAACAEAARGSNGIAAAGGRLIGFLDDDPAKNGKVIHGLRVFGGNGDLGQVCEQQEVDEVVISSSKMPEGRIEEVVRCCAERQITVRRMKIMMEELSSN